MTEPNARAYNGSLRALCIRLAPAALLAAVAAACGGSGDDARFRLPLEDDFSDPQAGWPIVDDPTARTRLGGGRYSVLVKQPQQRQNVRYFFEPDAEGVTVEVTASARGGRAGFGVTCWSSESTAYALGLDAEGDYSIVKVVGDEDVEVLAALDADLDLQQPHRVRGECVAHGGSRPLLILSVDGQAVAESRDSRAFGPFRGVGLFVTTAQARGEVVFDDFDAREI